MSEQELLEQIKEAKAQAPTKRIDIAEQILNKVAEEKAERQKVIDDKNKATEFYDRVFVALTKIRSRRVAHPKTKKFIGIKFKYKIDGYGKTIYDYICYNKDSFEKKLIENLEIKFDPNDKKDGGWIDKRISIAVINPRY